MKKLSKFLSVLLAMCVVLTSFTAPSNASASTVTDNAAIDALHADAILYEGSSTGTSTNSNLAFLYTKHIGGDWDAAQINEGSYFYVEYTGVKDGIYLVLSSASGAKQWVAVYPDETGKTSSGSYYSLFKYANFSKVFGTNFARLDEILAYTTDDKSITLNKIAYFAGQGKPVDTSDGSWDRSKEGIAFIGDSIVQNALSKYGDWNEILGRTNCVNYGIGGQTTVECLKRIDAITNGNYSKVVMLCGINDLGHGIPMNTTIANYKSMFEKIHTAHPDTQIYVISVLPTTSVFFKDAQSRITDLDSAIKNMIADYSYVTFVNCFPKFEGKDGYCIEDYVIDGLHPNETGYAVIANVLNPYLGGTVNIKIFTANLSKTSYIYDGSSKMPYVTVKSGDKTLVNGTDYKVDYKSNKLPGTANVTITGIGSYTGTIKKTFKIKMDVPTATVTSGTKKAAIKWSKLTSVSGYEVRMATSKYGKYSLIKSANSTTATFTKTGLNTGKKYYFKVRAYVTDKSKKTYGAYSDIQSVKVK